MGVISLTETLLFLFTDTAQEEGEGPGPGDNDQVAEEGLEEERPLLTLTAMLKQVIAKGLPFTFLCMAAAAVAMAVAMPVFFLFTFFFFFFFGTRPLGNAQSPFLSNLDIALAGWVTFTTNTGF